MAFRNNKKITALEEKVESVKSETERAVQSIEKTVERMEQKIKEYNSQTEHSISMMRWTIGLGISALLTFTLYHKAAEKPPQYVHHCYTPCYQSQQNRTYRQDNPCIKYQKDEHDKTKR